MVLGANHDLFKDILRLSPQEGDDWQLFALGGVGAAKKIIFQAFLELDIYVSLSSSSKGGFEASIRIISISR